jgi:UDP-galactopyranose mutase
MKDLLVFSHLRWDFVYQRPQHLLSRLAKQWRVIYVEEPLFRPGNPTAELQEVAPGITVVRFHTPIAAPGFHDEQLPVLRGLLQTALADLALSDYGVWFYTPMALPLLTDLQPVAITYDCMDELSAFRNSPKQLVQRETALLRIANVVFTGGPSLYRQKRAANPQTHCIPSSVDRDHFRHGRDAARAAGVFAQLPHPRLGFYGVIDERFDVDLLAGVAALRPEWQFCMVGPVVKIDPASLPQLPNVHYLLQQSYSELPGLLAAWDVCLLPFARNEATRFISPTKTLEYLAAQKPVVSTSITDVGELYGAAVRFADTPADFVAACEALLNESADERAQRIAAADALVAATSWDAAAAQIQQALEKATATGLKPATALLFAPAEPASHKPPARTECLIIGAGPTGLSAAYHYGREATLLEANDTVGGWCRSIKDSGFTFDHAGHIMFSNSVVVQDLYRLLLGDNVLWQDREAWVYSKNTYTRYPFQGALYGLPPKVLKDCLMGAIEARYGNACRTDGTAANAVAHDDCCADGTAIDDARSAIGATARAEPANFEEFIYKTWGRGIAEHFAIPYNHKLWSYPLREMETSWLGGRVPLPDLEQMIEGALSPVPRPMGPNARFGYPLRGGFQAMMDGFVPLLRGKLHLRSRVRRVRPSRHEVELDDGRVFPYDALISTMPLPALISAIGAEAPVAVREAAAKLRRVSVRCVNLGIGRANLTEKHWIYYPEDTIFHRVFVQGNASPYCNPPGGFGLTCEISYSSVKPLPLSGQALIDRCIADCIRVGLFHKDDPVWTANEVDMPYAYVLYDHSRADSVRTIRTWLETRDITLAGRYSEWEYYNSDHAFLAGKTAAESVKAAVQAEAGAKLA